MMKKKQLIRILMESPLYWLLLVEERLELIQGLMKLRQPPEGQGQSARVKECVAK